MNDEEWTNKINRVNLDILDEEVDYCRPIIEVNISIGNKDEKMRKRCWKSIVFMLKGIEGAISRYNVRDELGRFTARGLQ